MRASGWLVGAGALLAGLIILALGLELAGYDSGAALGALWSGAFGSWFPPIWLAVVSTSMTFRMSSTLIYPMIRKTTCTASDAPPAWARTASLIHL